MIALFILCVTGIKKPVIHSCLKTSALARESTIVIANSSESNTRLLSRLTTISTAAFITAPGAATSSCCFLVSLLAFAEDISVCSFFEKLVRPNESRQRVHKWLLEYGIVEDMTRVIEGIDYSREISNAYTDSEVWRLKSYYNIVCLATENPNLRDAFQCQRLLSALTRTFRQQPGHLEAARIRALTGMLSGKLLGDMKDIIKEIIDRLHQPFFAATEDLVEMINFVTSACNVSGEISATILETQLLKVLLGLVIQFNEASMLHTAFRRFTMDALENQLLCGEVVKMYLEFFMSEAEGRSIGEVGASCWSLINFIFSEKEKNEWIQQALDGNTGFEEFVSLSLQKYLTNLTSPYGGKLPKEKKKKGMPDAS